MYKNHFRKFKLYPNISVAVDAEDLSIQYFWLIQLNVGTKYRISQTNFYQ